MKSRHFHFKGILLIPVIILFSQCTVVQTPECPRVFSCEPKFPDPIQNTFDRADNPHLPNGTITDFGAFMFPLDPFTGNFREDSTYETFYDDNVRVPYKIFEFISHNRDRFRNETIVDSCPCDASLVVVDWRLLNIEEKTQLRQDNEDEKSNGGGNMILSLPMFNESTCYEEGKFAFFCPPGEPQIIPAQSGSPQIAILDTGLDSPIWEKLRANGYITESLSMLSHSEEVPDSVLHGSLITTIINQIAKDNARFQIYQTINSKGIGTAFDAICAMRCARKNNAKIANLSFGAYGEHSPLNAELDSMELHNIIVIASKGNDGYNTDTNYHIPSDHPSTFAVAATIATIAQITKLNQDDPLTSINYPPASANSNIVPQLWSCSNYQIQSQEPLLVAPGIVQYTEKIVSTPPDVDTISRNEVAVGTSFAAAYVSGIAAQFVSRSQDMSAGHLQFKQHTEALGNFCNNKGNDTFQLKKFVFPIPKTE